MDLGKVGRQGGGSPERRGRDVGSSGSEQQVAAVVVEFRRERVAPESLLVEIERQVDPAGFLMEAGELEAGVAGVRSKIECPAECLRRTGEILRGGEEGSKRGVRRGIQRLYCTRLSGHKVGVKRPA